jgi:hypothetical protein
MAKTIEAYAREVAASYGFNEERAAVFTAYAKKLAAMTRSPGARGDVVLGSPRSVERAKTDYELGKQHASMDTDSDAAVHQEREHAGEVLEQARAGADELLERDVSGGQALRRERAQEDAAVAQDRLTADATLMDGRQDRTRALADLHGGPRPANAARRHRALCRGADQGCGRRRRGSTAGSRHGSEDAAPHRADEPAHRRPRRRREHRGGAVLDCAHTL